MSEKNPKDQTEASEEGIKISKSMLIIKSDANALRGVEQFLKNRDWFLNSTHQMKDAVLFLVQNKPSFVLIAVDHPNPKIKKLPKVLSSAFPCCVMVFAEKSTTNSFKLLMDSGVEYKINPPITGPAIERAVNKYIRDQEQANRQQSEGKQNGENGKSNFDFQVEIKSGGEKSSNVLAIKGGASDSESASAEQTSLAQKLLAQLTGEEIETPGQPSGFLSGPSSGGKNQESNGLGGVLTGSQSAQNLAGTSNGTSHAQGQGGTLGALNSLQNQNGNKDSSGKPMGPLGSAGGSSGQEGSNESGGALINLQRQKKSDENDLPHPTELALETGAKRNSKKEKAESALDPLHAKAGEDVLIGNPQKKKTSAAPEMPIPESPESLIVPPAQKNKSTSEPATLNPNNKQAAVVGREIEDSELKGQTPADSLKLRKGANFDKESVFVKGVNHSLDDTVNKGDGKIQVELEDNSHLACIIVESNRFSGYLVAALGKDKKLDSQFVELVRLKLVKFLKDNGEPIENEKNLELKVRRVDFEGWALEYAQFLRKSVHKGDEVAMAFFPFADAQTKVGESAQENMVSVKTEDIQTEVPLEFNMYIYLPTNKKYILYTPQGGVFLSEQKARLTRQGVTKMHIQKDDVQNLSKFKAQNHLNSLIQDYESQGAPQKKKKTA